MGRFTISSTGLSMIFSTVRVIWGSAVFPIFHRNIFRLSSYHHGAGHAHFDLDGHLHLAGDLRKKKNARVTCRKW